MNKSLVWGAYLLGIIFILIAIYYWMTPAYALPTFFPGYEQGVVATHVKHGIASLIVGVALLVVGWFGSGPRRA